MDGLNPERNPWPEDHATTPKLDWETPEMNPWPKGHATTVVGALAPR